MRAIPAMRLGWAVDSWRALRPFGDGAYVNVPNAPASHGEREYYGSQCRNESIPTPATSVKGLPTNGTHSNTELAMT